MFVIPPTVRQQLVRFVIAALCGAAADLVVALLIDFDTMGGALIVAACTLPSVLLEVLLASRRIKWVWRCGAFIVSLLPMTVWALLGVAYSVEGSEIAYYFLIWYFAAATCELICLRFLNPVKVT
jgi:hypothetical protein